MKTCLILLVSVIAVLTPRLEAAFHLMQIEQVIGGVAGGTSQQAIQLRMRSANQNVIASGRLRAYDATGANPVLLLDPTTSVTGSASGSTVLFASPAFNTLMSSVPGYAADYTLANLIPASYFNGGKIAWENNAGAIQWSLAFGAYTGTNTGLAANTVGATGDFGAPFASALPTTGVQSIRFTGAANAQSSANSTDYAINSVGTTVRNNAGSSFAVVPEPGTVALVALGALALSGSVFSRRRRH